MASFSPSPAPRRSSRLRHIGPNNYSPPRHSRLVNTLSASRLSTPNDDDPSLMDVDDAPAPPVTLNKNMEYIFAKNSQLTVSFYVSLPVEVTQILKNADFYNDFYSGDIDTLTGFALVASASTCFVWQHAQALRGIPTCYIFACPQDGYRTSPPFHGLIPFGSSREPGLVLLSPSGELRFWDSIGIGLAGGDNYSLSNLPLRTEEVVTHFVRAAPQTFIASTSIGTFFRLVLTSTGGKYHLAFHPFARPSNSLSFSRLIPSIFSSSSNVSLSGLTPEPGNVNSIALGKTSADGTEVWALVDTRIQKWSMKLEGWEEILFDEDIMGIVRTKLRSSLGRSIEPDNAKLDLELVDLSSQEASENSSRLAILVSYAGREEDNVMAMDASGVRRYYALVELSCQSRLFKAERVTVVPYQSTSSSGAPMHPRMQEIAEGQVVVIQFGDAVALCARDSDYSDRLQFKSATDRTLGVGVVQQDPTIIILTASTMMKTTLNLEAVSAFDNETGRATLIKSIMTEAILYGSSPTNPLYFSFPPEVDEESLMRGAEQLSQAVLRSDPSIVGKNQDLNVQMSNRKEHLSWLIRFINDNAVLGKISQSSRQRLAADAEKLHAGHQLWIRHSERMGTNPPHSVLNDVLFAHRCEARLQETDDSARDFFTRYLDDLGFVVKVLPHRLQQAKDTGRNILDLLPEANSIVLTIVKSAFDFRDCNMRIYGVEQPMLDAWTSHPDVIDVVSVLFEKTAELVDLASSSTGEIPRDCAPYTQLPDLASILFACIEERLTWLGSLDPAEGGVSREREVLQEHFKKSRPQALQTLRRTGHDGAAFSLAEKYRDFSSLAELCHSPDQNPNYLRIQAYIERFKDEFTSELYRWYIQHGELRKMFSQDEIYSTYLEQFFADHPTPGISWIHDLGCNRHEAAARALRTEAKQSSYLEAKHLMLSIGKLAHLAQLQEDRTIADPSELEAFDDELNFVNIHETLQQEFRLVQTSLRGRQSLDTQIDAIVQKKAHSLSDRPILTKIFRNLVRELFQGRVLSVEDTVDVLTLKDNYDAEENNSTVDNYLLALQLLNSAQDIPDARRRSAVWTVWRRVYLHDDWNSLRSTRNVPDAELAKRWRKTALYHTLVMIRGTDMELVPPDAALQTPSHEELSSRWQGLSPEELENLSQDYDIERDRLGELELEEQYETIRELALQSD